MNDHRFSRRAFARATGLSIGLLPLLSTDREAKAQSGTSPRRLILMCWPNGVRSDHWFPDNVKGSIDYKPDPARPFSGTNFTFEGLKMNEPLEPHRADILLFQGLNIGKIAGDGHNTILKLFDVGGGNTLDQHVAAKIGNTKFRTLNLGVQKRDSRGFIYRNGQGVTLENDPFKLFDSLFAAGGLDASLFEKQRQTRKSVLDYVGKQLEGFGKTLGTEDRDRVGFHLQNFREVERRLTSTDNQVRTQRPASLPTTKFDVINTENFDRVMRAHMDLMILALASDLTRVITMACSDGDAFHLLMPWLGADFRAAPTSGGLGNDNNHHSHAHAEDAKHITMQRWFVQQFADFFQRMKTTPTLAGGNLFDSTITYVMNTMNTGGGHGTNNLPTFIAGGAGALRTGRYLRRGANPKELHAAVAAAMGAPLGTPEYPDLRV